MMTCQYILKCSLNYIKHKLVFVFLIFFVFDIVLYCTTKSIRIKSIHFPSSGIETYLIWIIIDALIEAIQLIPWDFCHLTILLIQNYLAKKIDRFAKQKWQKFNAWEECNKNIILRLSEWAKSAGNTSFLGQYANWTENRASNSKINSQFNCILFFNI